MSEPTLQQEIEALRPATEGTLQQVAKGVPLMGRDPDGKAKMINVDENGNVKVQLKGSVMELYVTAWSDLPPADSVPLGTMAQLVGTTQVRQSNGTRWVVLV